MPIQYLELDPSSPLYEKVNNLYMHAFPYEERMQERVLLSLYQCGLLKITAVMDDFEFVGFSFTSNTSKILYIFYLAILPEYQRRGYGTFLLKHILERNLDKKVFVDIEEVKEEYEDYEVRKKREHFYLEHDFVLCKNAAFSWQDINYDIYSAHGSVTKKEITKFWTMMMNCIGLPCTIEESKPKKESAHD